MKYCYHGVFRKLPSRVGVAMRQCLLPPSRRRFLQFAASRILQPTSRTRAVLGVFAKFASAEKLWELFCEYFCAKSASISSKRGEFVHESRNLCFLCLDVSRQKQIIFFYLKGWCIRIFTLYPFNDF